MNLKRVVLIWYKGYIEGNFFNILNKKLFSFIVIDTMQKKRLKIQLDTFNIFLLHF